MSYIYLYLYRYDVQENFTVNLIHLDTTGFADVMYLNGS